MPSLFDNRGALLEDAELKRSDGPASARAIARVRHMLGPFVLRRLKSEVLQQLTPKTQRTEAIGQTAGQASLYGAAVAAVRKEVVTKAAAKPAAAKAQRLAPHEDAPPPDVERAVGAARLKALFTYLRKARFRYQCPIRHSYLIPNP
jgi:SNF2 family DNA or RNA helicase